VYPDGNATSLRTVTLPNGVGYGSHYREGVCTAGDTWGIRESTQGRCTVFPQSALECLMPVARDSGGMRSSTYCPPSRAA